MDELWLCSRLLFLLAVANSSPIAAKHLLGAIWSMPLDRGWRFVDGQPLFGSSKTARGLVAALLCTAVAAVLIGLSFRIGFLLGALAMLGDLLSSFVKRRLSIAAGGRATGIDQIPEALLPLLVLCGVLGLSMMDIAAITLAFLGFEILLSPLFFRLGFWDHPY